MAEPRMVTCDLCGQPREAGFLHASARCMTALLVRVRELEAQLATGFEAFQAKCEELRNSVPRSRYDIANQQYNELQAKLDRVTAKARAEIERLLAEREGAAVVKLAQLEQWADRLDDEALEAAIRAAGG